MSAEQRLRGVVAKALTVNTGNELEPITDVYSPDGCAIVILAALRKAGYEIVPSDTVKLGRAMTVHSFYCPCGFSSSDHDAIFAHDKPLTPDMCCNCGGRRCMDCVLRYMHDECEDSCPQCCVEP